jgi:hypothetical protein
MKILIVCGGRDYANYRLVDAAINAELTEIRHLVTGDAAGADSHAWNSAVLRKIKQRSRLRADWEALGRDAGPVRNEKMLERARELTVEYPTDSIELWAFRADLWAPARTGGNGTLDMCSRALRFGIHSLWFSDSLLPYELRWEHDRVVAVR